MKEVPYDSYIWQDGAACRGLDESTGHAWFYSGLSKMPEMYAAQKICAECPVRQECWDEATEDDQRFTIRGGKLPTMAKASIKRARTTRKSTCRRGHDLTLPNARMSDNRCRECKNLNARLHHKPSPRVLRTHCLNGHEYTEENTRHRKNGTRLCRTCKSSENKKRYRSLGKKATPATMAA